MTKATKKPWVIGKPDFEDPYVDVPKLELESKINDLVEKFETEYAPIGVIQKINSDILIEYADESEEESHFLKDDIMNSIETMADEISSTLVLNPEQSSKVQEIIENKFKRFVGNTDFKYPVKLD